VARRLEVTPKPGLMEMKILGLDFTSRPTKRKPITCASGSLDHGVLELEAIERFVSFAEFEALLARPGPWRAGFDFPFGQPRKLLTNLGLKGDWVEVVTWFTNRAREDFVDLLSRYRSGRPEGDKQHRRQTDKRARSCSPMMVYGTPVAKMFFEGAPRLLKSGVSILPVRPRDDSRVAVEAYPKLVAERYADGGKYKAEPKRDQDMARRRTRVKILSGLEAHAIRDFGFQVRLATVVRDQAAENPTGDVLDAVLAAVQAAWSAGQRQPPDGVPEDCDRVEGWIVDPSLLRRAVE
jgi:hypothetical protein